ncbi:MAG: AarF/UbiB family protein, partial [Acidimicrobiales bacterium]
MPARTAAHPFAGPYAEGVPTRALRIVCPSLTRFGWRELVRGVEIAAVLAWHVVGATVRHLTHRPTALLRLHRDRAARTAMASAVSVGLVEGFMALGPTFVKLGQLIASSPGMFPVPLADACMRTLDDVPPFPGDEALAMVEEDLGAAGVEIFRDFDPQPLSAASIAQVHACT